MVAAGPGQSEKKPAQTKKAMTMKRLMTEMAMVLGALVYAAHGAGPAAAETFITVASTTSTQHSGLYDYILPRFTTKTGITVRVIAVGTGQAVRLAKNGDADVLFVHHKASEEKFVADGFGIRRFDVMVNDFVLLGPESDPAVVGGRRTSPRRFRKSPGPRQRLPRAATTAARIRRNCLYGRRRAPTRRRPRARGTGRRGPAWGRP